ncbi:LOW QUALITY PROTEIN: protein PML-like [Sphaerodactylus townsendi]|uniref:LOW QUALITY PROTEIN: protein PML-like n=1 Tax=Sphaerodactylus townsendi TaxID=933632 RepID=UPI002025E6C7|nr:LOW QUALITY PROTEIN: protein PML-like [Sphaerodactylus townsendi]
MAQDVSGSSSVPPENSDVDEEFKFLLCQNCHQEAERPNLLSCLHNLCAECLQETTLGNRCPVCQAPHSQTNTTFVRPNSFFADLRTKLGVFRKISRGQELACDNCGKEGTHWCFDCEEFLCSACFANHQRYLKKQSHEARAMEDLRASSSKEFLSESKNASIMSCSTKEHRLERLSIYCKVCQRPLCCTCALLDYGHSSHHCHIQEEIQRRQREMLSMSSNLGEMETAFETSCGELRDKVDRMVEEKDKTREQIRQRVTEMVQLVEKKGEMFLAAVEDEHRRKVQEVEETLQNGERVGQRLASGRQLVDTMRLYASDQEVLDMYPFVWKSLEELARRHYPWEQEAERKETLRGSRSGYADFLRKSDDRNETLPAAVTTASNQKPSGKSSAKRKHVESTSRTPTRFIKIEANDEQPGTNSGYCPAEKRRKTKDTLHLTLAKRPRSDAKDTETIPKICFSISPPESSSTDPASCLNGGTEDISSHDEPSGSTQQEDTNSRNSQDGFHPPIQRFSEQGTLVFFDMKVLSKTENALHLVAVKDETKCFSVIIHPGGYERGLESFLHYLRTLHQPILVGYNLWSMNLALLVKYLEALRKGEAFRDAIFGFLDASPLIKEKLPNRRSYTLKSLYHDSFEELLDNDQPLECAKALEELCTVLEVNPGMDRRPVVPYSSLQNYLSLQPLLDEKCLSHSAAQTLALNNISFSTLLAKYQKDPARGLEQFAQSLNSRPINSSGMVRWLRRVQTYFRSRLSSSRRSASVAKASRTCLPS